MRTEEIQPESERRFDEFSPKKILFLTGQTGRYMLSQWKWIVGIGLLFGMGGAIKAYVTKPVYTAEISFTLDEGSAETQQSVYARLAAQLGLPGLNTAGGVFTNIPNILELMKSRFLIDKTLRSNTIVNGKTLTLADFFLDSLEYREKWMKGSPSEHTSFAESHRNDADSLYKNNIISTIYQTLLAKNLAISQKGTGSSIIVVSCNSENELFSKYFLESLVNEVTGYYIETKTKRAMNNVDFLQKRIDSIRNVYTGSLYNRAAGTDANLNIVRETENVGASKKETDIQISKNTYIELVSSLEAARTLLTRDMPLFQYVDVPILPLKVQRASSLTSFILFFVVGTFLTIIILLTGKFFRFVASR